MRYVKHSIALKNLQKSHLKLLVIPNTGNNKGIITGKLFEYLATDGFVLGLGSKVGDAAKILNETKAGQVFEYSDDLEKKIYLLYEKWKSGSHLKIDRAKIEKYTRKNLTNNLANIFDQLVEN